MGNEKKYVSVILDMDTHYKIKHIACYERRSLNRQMLYLTQKYIEDFEAKHGKITKTP